MKKRLLEDVIPVIRRRDKRKFDSRVRRLKELGTITTSSIGGIPLASRGGMFLEEAGECYMEGCFRSCIFCCSSIVEQTFKHEIILNSEDPEETYWEIEINRVGFDKLIKRAKGISRLRPYIKEADWLKGVRNTIAVHPLYIARYSQEKETPEMRAWGNKTIIRDIRKILTFLDKNQRRKVENFELRFWNTAKVTKSIKLKNILANPLTEDTFIMWDTIREPLLGDIALESYKKMAKVIEGLYPA